MNDSPGEQPSGSGQVRNTLRHRMSRFFRTIIRIPTIRLAFVVPLAVVVWLLAERIVSPLLQFLVYAEQYITVFLSHFAAVLSTGYIAPRAYSRQAILVIAIIFVSIRLIMGIAMVDEGAERNNLAYVLDVLSALAGLGLGSLWFIYKTGAGRAKREQENSGIS